MTHITQFSSDEERWSEISSFPGYSVSSRGRVKNDRNGSFISQTCKPNGLVMVGLMRDAKQNKRSLALLVARAFVQQPNETFDTPIHLNGDRSDNRFDNLAWRPLWFARKYMKQFVDNHNTYDFPIEDVETAEIYKNSMEASMINGVIDVEIRLSMLNNTYVWPTGQIFRDAIDRQIP